jgi:hypothetical protein
MATAEVHRSPTAPALKPQLHRLGVGHPLVVVDQISGDLGAVRALAAALAPFPPAPHFYPGVRRVLDEADIAWTYARSLVEAASPFVAGAFDCEAFDLVEASFSIVTTAPTDLAPPQRAPHFDGTDPDLVAMLHYLGDFPGSGTAFFRHRATGIEAVTEANLSTYVGAARTELATGYVQGSNAHYDELHRVEARADRLLIYSGNLLHSGIIPSAMPLDADPLHGRLTANYFLRLTR